MPIIIISTTFPANHPEAGKPTGFEEKILKALGYEPLVNVDGFKITTCRSNYTYWEKQIKKLKAKGGFLSVRKWKGHPYRSSQIEIARIPAEVLGIQKLILQIENNTTWTATVFGEKISLNQIADNDGLSIQNYKNWFLPEFSRQNTTKIELAVIHFTNYRY